MIIDTHSHCYWESLASRIDEIIASMQKNDILHAVQIGCDVESSKQAIALARQYPEIFSATVGHHPETAQDVGRVNGERGTISEQLQKLIVENREYIVAVGECGFDFHYLDGSEGGTKLVDLDNLSQKAQDQIQNQKAWWLEQWSWAKKYNLPLVIHTRDARDETLRFMKEHGIDRCVMHCFSEDWDFARELLDFSDEIYFSFSGILTYKNALSIQEAAQKIPLHRILVETDAPFLAPIPLRGTVNEPANTRYTLEKLMILRTESREEIETTVYENSRRFYII